MQNTRKKKNKITLQNPAHYKNIPSRYYFQRWVNLALDGRKNGIEITIRIVNVKESAQLNQDYRGKIGPTNILSFPFELPDGIVSPLLGDLIICAPIVAKEAKLQNKLELAHWAHLVIHGILHLLGYDHIKNKDAIIMESIEIELLNQLGFDNPYEY